MVGGCLSRGSLEQAPRDAEIISKLKERFAAVDELVAGMSKKQLEETVAELRKVGLTPSLTAPEYTPESIAEDHAVKGIYRAGSDHRKDGQAVGW